MIDFKGVARTALAHSRTLVPSWLPAGRLRGHEFVCGGVSGEPGESLSVNLVSGKWADFATGQKGGDLTSLYAAVYGKSQVDAARELGESLGGVVEPAAGAVKAKWTPILPVPDYAPKPPREHFRHGKPVHVAEYRNLAGALLGLVYRCEPDEGGKETLPLVYAESDTGARQWRWQSLPKPRSLFGAELLGGTGRVLIVEGELKCEAARRMLGAAMIVVAWPGGANAVAHADWSLLAGRDCVIWPDADGPGINAAAQICIQLRHHGATARVVDLPEGLAKGWDLGDAELEGWDCERIMSYVDPREPEPETGGDWEYESSAPAVGVDYAPLGHDRGRFYFFSFGAGQVRELTGRDLFSVSALCELASLRHWEMNYPGKGEAGFNVRAAGDALTRACYAAGIYDPGRIRGLGAWLDEGRTVLHVGDRCIVDGEESSIVLPGSRHIYENAARLNVDLGEPLSSFEANRLRELCVAAPWERPDHMGQLLAGWCVIAPVCGAMPWRPHLWITSEAGGGKSWVLDNIIKPTVGALALSVQSKTTEAALRQALGCDARPIIFDEIETQNERDRDRVQHVLDLARQASSEDGAAILKGSSAGKVTRFRIRSCFAFASINVGVTQAADESRTVVLTLKPDEDMRKRSEAFERLRALHAQTMKPGFSGRLLARTLSLLPVIRANAVLFAEAIARSGKPRRLGDTYGVLMAGAWSLRSRAVVTAEEADAAVAGTQWVREAVAKAEVEPEWSMALSALLQYRVRVLGVGGRPEDVPVGDLVNASVGRFDDCGINPNDARIALHRMGMRVQDGELQIANNSQGCALVFIRTPWATSWRSTLCRMPGASKNVGSARLAGHISKIFSLPLTSVAVG